MRGVMSNGKPGVITAEAVQFLSTPAGSELLAEAACLPPDLLVRLERLRRRYPAPLAAAAVQLLELRQRARSKFSRAEEMFLTPEGLEQSTGEAIARYRASRFPHEAPVLDACCGVGGDAIILAERGPVLAVDRNEARVACARANGRVYTASYPIACVCADVTTLDLARLHAAGVDAAFCDPSRRRDTAAGERRRVRRGEEYAPPLAWTFTLRSHFSRVCIKISPAIKDDALRQLGGIVEFISRDGECKEAAVWSGPDMGPPGFEREESEVGYCATVLPRSGPLQTLLPGDSDPAPLAVPQEWLYEPDPAVIRAHLVPEVAARLQAAQIDSQIAYLTAARLVSTPFATAYRILESMPFNLKQIRAWLKRQGRRVEVVKRRGVAFEPEEIRRRLAGATSADGDPVVLVLTRITDKPAAILCEPPQ